MRTAAGLPRPTIGSFPVLRGYLDEVGRAGRAVATGAATGGLRMLFLDRDNRLLRDNESGDRHDGFDQAPSPTLPRGLVRCAVELGAAAVILVRQRPDDGGTEPTAAEIENARLAHTALAALEVELHDYVVVAGTRWCASLRSMGLLRKPLRVAGIMREPSAHGRPD